jgi:hypothetical protein
MQSETRGRRRKQRQGLRPQQADTMKLHHRFQRPARCGSHDAWQGTGRWPRAREVVEPQSRTR